MEENQIEYDKNLIQEGQFFDYHLNGYGRIIYSDGGYYIGFCKNDEKLPERFSNCSFVTV